MSELASIQDVLLDKIDGLFPNLPPHFTEVLRELKDRRVADQATIRRLKETLGTARKVLQRAAELAAEDADQIKAWLERYPSE